MLLDSLIDASSSCNVCDRSLFIKTICANEVQTEEWQRFIPGIRMYKGKKTLFYNGEILWDGENYEYLIYDEEEQHSWEVIIVLPGVRVIPEFTFGSLTKLEKVIMADDSVETIEKDAFDGCILLKFVKLSRNLECIGRGAFSDCKSLTSIFIPPSCRELALLSIH